MVSWERNTPWRQGNVIPYNVVKAIGIQPKNSEAEIVVVLVISHDCDLAQPLGVEPNVEIIWGQTIESVDGNFSYAKTARRLHLTLTGGSRHLSVNFVATQKSSVQKLALADYVPDKETYPTPKELVILQRWLAARYRRSAFPDEFDRRMEKTGLNDRIGKILKTSGDLIAAIYFDVDEGKDLLKSGPDDVYTLGVYLLYSTDIDPNAAEVVANNAKDAISRAFQDRCVTKTSGAWHDIELIECEAISDQAMTIQQAELLKRWSSDHFSLRPDPPQSMLRDE